MLEETEWIVRAQQGDTSAFDRIVARYQDKSVAYAYARLGDFAAAEDAVQDAFLHAYREISALREPAAFPAWFRRIVFKFCDRIRRHSREAVPLVTMEEMGTEDGNPAHQLEREARLAVVLAAISMLSPDERDAITLFYMGAYSVAEVAVFLGVTETAIKKRLQRARTRLQERILTMLGETLRENAPSRDNRFVEVTALLRKIVVMLEADPNVGAAYLAHFGRDEGFGAEDDVWASLNLHVVVADGAIDALATNGPAYVARVVEPLVSIGAPQNAPPDGYYRMALYDGESGPYEVDWYWHPRLRAVLPADTRLLFDRVGLQTAPEPTKWGYTEEMPDALRRVRDTMTEEEHWREGQENRVGLFWAMWLIAAKYIARDPVQAQVPFLGMLQSLSRDTRVALGDMPAPDGNEPERPNASAKIVRLRQLGADMEELMARTAARGILMPDRIVPRAYRFLDLIERTVGD